MYHLITYIAITCLWFLFWFIDMYCRTDVLAHYFLFFSSTVIHARSSDEFIIFFRQNTLCWNTIQVSWLIYQIQNRGKGKFFTYVTKTRSDLTTYSRKPQNYNGTIIFENNVMKKSSTINLNICQTWLFHKVFDCFFCYCFSCLLWSWAESAVSPAEKKCYFGFDSGKKCEF